MVHLIHFGDHFQIFKLGLEEKMMEQCCIDIEIENQDTTLNILRIISSLIEIGTEYASGNESEDTGVNPFINSIISSKLKTYITAKTYHQNMEISNISFAILDQVEDY